MGLLYYLPMERMTPDTDRREGLGEGIYAKFVQNYEKLLEENKKLKEENEYLQNRVKGAENMIELLKEDKRSYEDKLTELMEFIEKNFGIE